MTSFLLLAFFQLLCWNLCAKLWCNTEFCPFTAIWSSWLLFVTDSILGLVKSCDSATQLNLVFVSDASAFALFNATVSRLLVWAIVLLHDIAAAIGVSNFRLLHSWWCLCNHHTWINEMNSSQISGILKFRFLECPFLFFFWAAFPIFHPSFRPYMIWSSSRLNFLSVSSWTTKKSF